MRTFFGNKRPARKGNKDTLGQLIQQLLVPKNLKIFNGIMASLMAITAFVLLHGELALFS